MDKKQKNTEKKIHPRNKHQGRYDLKLLSEKNKALAPFVSLNKYNDLSIDFFSPTAVKALNKALLNYYYQIDHWEIPPNYLCPPIPGRADYIHHIADLLGSCRKGKIPKGPAVKCLDIGTGASCIYPIIGNKEYGWSFVGSDIDPGAIASAQKIIELNPSLKGQIELRLQENRDKILKGVIREGEYFDLTICNPPFHASMEEARSATLRKLKNLKQKKITKPILNFGGQNRELWCEGGEKEFIKNIIYESRSFPASCFWYSSIVSKESNLKIIYGALEKVKALDVKTIPMGQGNKSSRIVAWTFHTHKQQKVWMETKWR